MKTASIVSIGNEVLSGQTVDTNAAYLSRRLLSAGVPVVSSYTIGDDVSAIDRALKSANNDAEIILTTGGLGSTDDDLTRQGLSKFLDAELQFQKGLLEKIQDFFTRRGLQMPQKNKVQAYIPAGAKAIRNNLGTAPGIMARRGDNFVFTLPGVPSEMKQMFEDSVLPVIKELAGSQAVVVKKLKCFGTSESNIAEQLGSLMDRGRNPLINCTVNTGIITLHIIATTQTESQAEAMVSKDERLLRNLLTDLIYGEDEQTLAEVVGEKLVHKNMTVAVAESCTGGILAKLITDVAGASRYFTFGWVTYSNTAKISELGVPADLIEKYGAVSEEVARSMAKCARKKAGVDYAIGITGIAGPTGGSRTKPVGLVYICLDSDGKSEVKRNVFSGSRGSVRLRAARTALKMLGMQLSI